MGLIRYNTNKYEVAKKINADKTVPFIRIRIVCINYLISSVLSKRSNFLLP